MFYDSGQETTTLVPNANGKCIACPAGTTSGSGKYVEGQNPCPCLIDSGFRTALALWFSDPALATSTYGNIEDWCTKDVTDMSKAFNSQTAFNEDISGWDVSSVTNMEQMFAGTNVFNQDIGSWNVSSVTNMQQMFEEAYVFNKDIGSWDVSSVTDMVQMFTTASAFDKDVKGWNVCKVDKFDSMFTYSGQPDTNLEPDTNGACIDCPSGTTSGSGEYVTGGNNCTSF
ncbi:hypothetical protein TrCOL_g5125 [Triparma columacea]|uniref:BspA family leucine-rich repeat surface protein n=1 Tax=Triparma columacea TaxID=722753 RepID=A0A9W7G8U4_9STRA|nr:hypothetical protein TrCOL_g5125 [Triparma columacea]